MAAQNKNTWGLAFVKIDEKNELNQLFRDRAKRKRSIGSNKV